MTECPRKPDNLVTLIERMPVPAPWSEGDNIPWNDPGFSHRMLQEHLSQSHDWASRRAGTIDNHAQWLHEKILEGNP